MIAIGSDHGGYALKQQLMKHLTDLGLEYKDYGTYSEESCDYPIYAEAVARAVAGGEAERGILICGTGIGMSLAANKVKGIRCVACSEPYSARLSRAHNNANMLAIGARVIGPEMAKMIVGEFLNTAFEGGRHQVRVDMLTALENGEEIE